MLYNIFFIITQNKNIANFTCKLKICMKRTLPSVILLIFIFCFFSKADYPLVRNFSKQKYGADNQNWGIDQLPDGRIVVANKRGLLTFDGLHWSQFPLDNYSDARSVMVDSIENRIYVGGSWTMGYFSYEDEDTDLTYHSLLPTLSRKVDHIGDVWNVMKYGNDIIFQGDYDLFGYDGKSTRIIPIGEKILSSRILDGIIYVALRNGRFCRIENDRLIDLQVKGSYKGYPVAGIIRHPESPGKGLMITSFNGCYSFDKFIIEDFPTSIDGFMKDAQVFCAASNGPEVAFGTVNSGVAIKNFITGETTFVGQTTGLQNSTVLSVFFDKGDNLWLGLDNGIDYVMHNSPVRLLFPPGGLYGTGYSSCLYSDQLLLGTNKGLYSVGFPFQGEMSTEDGVIKPIKELHGQIWNVRRIGDEIAVSGDLGLFIGKPGSLREVGKLGGVWNIDRINDDNYVVATYDNYHLIRLKEGVWTDMGIIAGFNEVNSKIVIDSYGVIWIANWQKGLYSMKLDTSSLRFYDVKHFNMEYGLPEDQNVTVAVIDGKVIVGTHSGFYVYDHRNDRFIRDNGISSRLPFNNTAHIYRSNDGSLWGVDRNRLMISAQSASGKIMPTDSTSFSFTAANIVPGFDELTFLKDMVISSSEEGFYVYHPKKFTDKHTEKCGLARIILNNDSVVSAFTKVAKEGKLKLPYNLSSVRFEAYLPEYRKEDAAMFSFYLEGYDKEWSAFSKSESKEYTRLGYGDYVLHLRAKNTMDGNISEESFKFSVATPWYWSIMAMIIYAVIFLIILYEGYKYIMRYTQEKAKRVEAKKEEEISQLRQAANESQRESQSQIETLQKEQKEQEITHLSESLTNATRNTMHRNEILLRINSRLTELQDSIKSDSPRTAGIDRKVSEVRKMIDDTLQRDDTLTQVDRHFEGLYGDYVERLRHNYPDLTKMEFRLCCFIKMGLSTKEIAPLMNVAPKSVEMSRYRLRKKLKLEREVNLAQFLQDF